MRLLFWRSASERACDLALGAVEAMRVEMVALHEQTMALARAAQDRSDLLQAIVLSNPSTAEMLFAVGEAEEMLKIPVAQGEGPTMKIQAQRNPTPAFEPDQLNPAPHRARVDRIDVTPEQHAETFAKVKERTAYKPLRPTLSEMRLGLEQIQDQLRNWEGVRNSAAQVKAGLDSALDDVSDALAEEPGLSRADRQNLGEKAKGLAWRIAAEERRIVAAKAAVERYKAELKAFDHDLLKALEAERRRSQRISAALGA